MKTLITVVFSLAVAVAVVAQAPKSPGPPPAKGAAKDVKKDEPPPKIEGVPVSRGEKGYIGIQIVNSTFKVTFYDQKKKPTPPDMQRAILRYKPNYKVGDERYMLSPGGDEFSLVSPRVVRPPYTFTPLYVILMKGDANADGDAAGNETFTVDFHQ